MEPIKLYVKVHVLRHPPVIQYELLGFTDVIMDAVVLVPGYQSSDLPPTMELGFQSEVVLESLGCDGCSN